jgi:hypothetical protein
MSTVSLPASDRAVKVDPGPELRSVGRRLNYPVCNLAAAAAHHARHGTVEGCEVVDPDDVQTLDRAVDSDWQAAYAEACGPADWTEPEPEVSAVSESDREWWAQVSNAKGGVPCASL